MVKKRYWIFIGYPESLPIDWLDKLTQTGLPFCVSPLHEFDVQEDGTLKKPHYHIILAYNGPTTLKNVTDLTQTLNCPVPQWLDNIKGGYEYLTHKNHKEKYQYNEEFIQCYNGFDISNFIDYDKTDLTTFKKEILEIIYSEEFDSFSDFIFYLMNHNYIYLDIVMRNSYFYISLINSQKLKKELIKYDRISN